MPNIQLSGRARGVAPPGALLHARRLSILGRPRQCTFRWSGRLYQPRGASARMGCSTEVAATVWVPSYRRATVMQASLAIIGFCAGLSAWLLEHTSRGSSLRCLSLRSCRSRCCSSSPPTTNSWPRAEFCLTRDGCVSREMAPTSRNSQAREVGRNRDVCRATRCGITPHNPHSCSLAMGVSFSVSE